jgi:hypothetical protein
LDAERAGRSRFEKDGEGSTPLLRKIPILSSATFGNMVRVLAGESDLKQYYKFEGFNKLSKLKKINL